MSEVSINLLPGSSPDYVEYKEQREYVQWLESKSNTSELGNIVLTYT